MKDLLCLLIFVCLICLNLSCNNNGYKGQYFEKSFTWDGKDRHYLVYLPSSYKEEQDFPLVVGLHGYTGTASGFENGWSQIIHLLGETPYHLMERLLLKLSSKYR